MPEKQHVLSFWFGELDSRGIAAPEAVQRWWRKSDAFDEEIRSQFGELRKLVLSGEREQWLDDALGTVAYVVTLDQFSRNLGRGGPAMYEADARALAASKIACAKGWHRTLGIDHASSLFMPLMHSEDLEDQTRGVALFEELSAEHPDVAKLSGTVKYAVAHRDIVERFGRFPHRNALLGRESTADELEFLEEPGSSF